MENSLENDTEARLALWRAICYAAKLLSGSCSVFISKEPLAEGRVRDTVSVPEVRTWQMMEALSLLAVVLKAENVRSKEICNIFGRTGPLHIIEEGENRYLWAQALLKGQKSSLGGRPDLLVTFDANPPTPSNILRIIECKCRQSIGAQVIRAEFGKAYDLKVTSYLIWSFITPSQSAIKGAKNLGIDIEALGFDTDMRTELIDSPEALVSHVANTIDMARREARLAKTINATAEKAKKKLLPGS